MLLVSLVALLVLSCQMQSGPPPLMDEHATLFYVVADNNLNYYAWKDLEEVEKGMDPDLGKVHLYFDGSAASTPSHPLIWEVNPPGNDGKRKSRIVRVYDEQDSASKETMETVLDDMLSLSEATQYSLVLWSHGSAWLAPDKSSLLADKGDLESKSFGRDGGKELPIAELVAALPDGLFAIAFDACYMGSVEVAYALRNKARYLLFSPTEILPNGFPYETLTPKLQQGTEIGLKTAARLYYNHYNDASNSEVYRSATITLVNTEYLENLAVAVQNIQLKNPDWRTTLKLSEIQRTDRSAGGILFDFKDVFDSAKESNVITLEQHEQILLAYDKTVLAFHATDWFFQSLDLKSVSGLNYYLPGSYKELDNEYENLEWYRKIMP